MIKADPNNKKTFIKIEGLADDMLYEIEKAFFEIGTLLKFDLQKGLRRGKRGGMFFKYGNMRLQCSAEGEYPQRVTGTLRSAVDFNVFSYKEMWFGITEEASYAKYLDGRRKLVSFTVESTDDKQHNILEKRIAAGVAR